MCDIDELLELADHLLQEMDVMSDKNKEMTETIRERVEKVLKLQNLIEDQTKSELEGMGIIFPYFFFKSHYSLSPGFMNLATYCTPGNNFTYL